MNPMMNQVYQEQLRNPFQNKVDKVLIDFSMLPRNISLKLRIRYTHTQDTLLRNQKFGKQVSPSRMHIQSVDGQSLYLSSSPLIDFPFNMKNMEGKFDSRTTMYLSQLHINALKQTLRSMLIGITRQDLFYYMNNQLFLNEELAQREKQMVPIKGMLLEIQYCIVRELSGNNEYSVYEGVRLVNKSMQTVAELTVDELDSVIDILDSIKMGEIILMATKLGLDLVNMSNESMHALNIPRQQIVT